jgi:2,5-diketo-D-gluconate reductase A
MQAPWAQTKGSHYDHPTRRLNDGHTMPQIGLGTASLNDDTVAPVIVTAIDAGYRHIDTAYRYGNQRGVGKGIRE